jgi:hypothetical protein
MSLDVLALNCTLSPSPAPSSTEKLLRAVESCGNTTAATPFRVADLDIKPGVSSDEGRAMIGLHWNAYPGLQHSRRRLADLVGTTVEHRQARVGADGRIS